MLKKQSIDQISVKKLCEKADINRSTFYRNYADIYALLESIVNECMEELFETPVSSLSENGDFTREGYEQILHVCSIIETKKKLYQQLLFGRTNTELLSRLTEKIYHLYLSYHESSSYVYSEEITLHYHFLAQGIAGLLFAWLKDDCTISKEKVASVAVEQITGFFLKMNLLYWTKERQQEERDR